MYLDRIEYHSIDEAAAITEKSEQSSYDEFTAVELKSGWSRVCSVIAVSLQEFIHCDFDSFNKNMKIFLIMHYEIHAIIVKLSNL